MGPAPGSRAQSHGANLSRVGSGTLTFAIPVRDPRGVADWSIVREYLAMTVRSLAAQQGPRPRIVLGVSQGTNLPRLPATADVVEVDLPYHPLPAAQGPERWDQIRVDKGLRLAHALAAVKPRGHVMTVDYDDLVSSRLSAHVAEHPQAPGWFVDAGYVWGGGPFASRLSTGFNELCGTSLIIRADLLRIPDSPGDPMHLERIKDLLGSHKRWRGLLALEPLPFPGAVYRVGSGYNASGAPTWARQVVRSVRQPGGLPTTIRALLRWATIEAEFVG